MRRRGGRKRALGTRAPMVAAAGSEPALVARLRQRHADRRPPLPDPGGGRRLHPRVPLPGGRHLAVGPAGRARARRRHRPARPTRRGASPTTAPSSPAWRSCNGRRRAASTGTTSRPASRTQNAFVESFNGRLRDELLNETLFISLAHARAALDVWRDDYNTVTTPQRARQSATGCLRQLQRLCHATGRDAALTAGLRAPSRCTTEPDRLK